MNGYKGPKWLDEMPGSSIAAVEVQRLMEPRPIDGDEIARKLPRGFVEAYSYLHSQALADAASLNGGRGYDETSDNRIKGGAKPPKKYGSGRAPLKSTRADGYLDTVNRKLRRIGREIKGFIEHNSPNAEMRQCSGRKCRRFADAEWLFCPWCGASTENIEGMK